MNDFPNWEGKVMKNDVRLKGRLKLYMLWPAIMVILLLAMNIWIFTVNIHAGLVMSLLVLIYIVAVALLYFYNKFIN